MASEPLTIAQLARAVGMGLDEIRSYQDQGLLQRARRTRGRHGNVAYHQEHLDRVMFIRRALDLHFSADDIARLIDNGTTVTCNDVLTLTKRHLAHLQQQQLPEQAAAVETLTGLVSACSGTGRRQDCRILAYLSGKPS